jgi:hypothetical protein
VFVLHVAAAQDLFVKDSNFLAQHGLALQAVDVNKTNLNAAGHNGWVFQITLNSNKMLCMDLTGERDDNGTPIQLWECNGHESQLWFFDDGSYKITWAGNSNKCLDAGDQQEGNTVMLWDCNGLDAQIWGYDGAIFLQNSASDASLCLDVKGAAEQSGTPLEIWGCNEKDQQQFSLQAGVTIRMFQDYHLCLDLPGGDTTNGNFLWLWECNGGAGQYWVYDTDNTRVQLAADLTKCLDAGDMQKGNRLMLWDCNGHDNQAFGYDPGTAAFYLASSSDASLCVDSAAGGLQAGAAIDVWECNYCWNQHFQFWGPSSSLATLSSTQSTGPDLSASIGDACPDVPGPAPPPPSLKVFPSDHCHYDTGVWPSFKSQQDLENDQYWSAYFNTIYGGIPSWGYPICPGAFQFLWKHAAKVTGVVQSDPTNCATGAGTNVGQELNDGTYYSGNSFLEARDAFTYIYNSKLFGASVPPNTFVEISHTVFPGDSGAIWYYMSVGSGVWLNVGKTAVYKDHADGVKDLLGTACHDQAQDTFGTHPTECEKDFPELYKAAQSKGLDTVQFTGHHDCTCGPKGDSSYKTNRWCNTEIIYFGDANGAAHGCTSALKGGWEASSDCNCREELKSSTNDAASVSYSNCGAH